MSCSRCNDGCNECACTCVNIKRCITKDCSCSVFLSTDCVNNLTEDLECSGIEKGQPLTEVLVQLDAFICTKFDSISGFFDLINVGTGVQIFSGTDNQGRKKIRTLLDSALINIVQGTNDITISVDEAALDTYIEANQSTYSASQLGTGADVYKDNTVVGDNTQFNFRSIIAQSQGTGDSILRDVQENTNDITLRLKSLKSNTLTITATATDITIEQPATATVQALYVNSDYVPSYTDFLAGNTKGNGSLAKPFTDTVSYSDPVTYSTTANSSIQNALNAYVGAGTALSPDLSGQKIVIQSNGGTYTFTGNFSYSNIYLEVEGYVSSTTTGYLLDMDDNTKFDDDTAQAVIIVRDGATLQVAGEGFRNSGNTQLTPTFTTGRIMFLSGMGTGKIYSATNNIAKYLIKSDPDSTYNSTTGANNDGNVAIYLRCNVVCDYQGVYKIGGLSKMDVFSEVTSGNFTNTVDTTLTSFVQTGGQVRFFAGSAVTFLGNTRTNALTFTPTNGFTPTYVSVNSSYAGTATTLFNKTNNNTVNFQVTNSISGYGPVVTNIFNSTNLWPVVFKDNTFASGTIDVTKADLSFSNAISSVNTIGSEVIETLRIFSSKANAATAGLSHYSAFIKAVTVNAGSFVVGNEYRVANIGSTNYTLIGATSNTVGIYFTASGVGSGSGSAQLITREVLV